MSRPFFSVVIDNHNYGRFLAQAVESVLGQDFSAREVELIVVDDGSTDDSRQVLARYGPRLRAVLQERQGQAEAFNRGFREARGEVVCLLDSDDLWLPGKLSRVAPFFDDKGVGGVEHWLRDVDASLQPAPQDFPEWPSRYRKEDFLDARTAFTATSGLAFRRESLERALPIPRELFYYLDDFLTVRVLLDSEMANLPAVLGFHRLHGANWCAGGYNDARKLDLDFRMREIFGSHLDRWLSERGLSPTPRFKRLLELELFRRRVLFEALSARPETAWRQWLAGARALGGSGRDAFRLATVLLAVLSPSLYLGLYSAYAAAPRLKDLRLRLLPGA